MLPNSVLSGFSRRAMLSALTSVFRRALSCLRIGANGNVRCPAGFGAAKQAIQDFVAAVTRQGSPDFVPPAERIATFDNDGTLWVEQPFPVQLC